MDVVFSVYIVTRGAVGARGKYECFVMQMLYVSFVCILWKFSMLHSA